jgi:hypothetical protein
MLRPLASRLTLPVLVQFLAAGVAWAVVPVTKPPVAQRVALADCVLVGKVKALEAQLVEAAPLLKIRGVGNLPYQVAVVQVESVVIGPKDLKEVRIAYVPPQSARGAFRRFAQVELSVDQEGCFFVRKHPDESFYVAQASYDLTDKAKEKDFAKELETVKRCAKLLENPTAGLKAKDAADRQLTAALLLYRYRTPTAVYTGKPKTEPIDAEQSRLILAAIAEGDWSVEVGPAQITSLSLFLRLGLGEEDGWAQPRKLEDWPAAAQVWLRKHATSYRIQKYVPEEKSPN